MLAGEVGERRIVALLAAALIALVCALALPAVSSAAELIEVDSTADEAALNPAVCLTPVGKCTLRAAIEASNSTPADGDTIVFDETVFEGQLADTIVLGSPLPPIESIARIEGRQCPTAAGVTGPCQGISGPGGAGPALTIEGADQVEIEGLSVTGAQTGISIIDGSAEVRVKGSWLGVKLDGSAGGNTTGIFIDPESNRDRIGGESEEARNVFANNSGDGLRVSGADETLVLGNYFGVQPDGVTQAANGKDIEVVSQPAGGFEATGNLIGVQAESEAATTEACDKGCNVIAGATDSGIDLEGDSGQGESPAVETHIAGNFIGLGADGSLVANATGVGVGSAADTLVGGVEKDEANHINGGQFGVLAGNAGIAAKGLVVEGNLIGYGIDGSEGFSPPGSPINIDSAGVSDEVDSAEVFANLISASGGVGIEQQGPGAVIASNVISDAENGIRTHGSTEAMGNLIENNLIAGSEASGILIENDLNEVFSNDVVGSHGVGIRIQAPGGVLPVTENLIGGDVEADENGIFVSTGAAIEISDLEATANEVARNHGQANGGLFIDLVAANPGTEPNGPNEGIKPPPFSTSTQSMASGSGAKEGATIRIFRKAGVAPGEIESFLGETQADAEGNWKVVYAGQIPAGTIVAATQTSKGATSELSTATSTADPAPPVKPDNPPPVFCAFSSSGCGGGPPNPRPAPQTKIGKGPKAKSHSTAAKFKFSASVAGSTFQCKLDKGKFKKCKSPKKYTGLKPGKHVFEVRAVNPAGKADPTPAKRKFTILG